MRNLFHDFKRYSGLIAGAVAIVFFPVFLPNPYYLNVANIIGLNAIVVVGLNLLVGYAGQISLGHAAFFGLGAYISGILSVTYNVSPWLALLIALVSTGLVAMAVGIPALKLHGHYLVMATLGFNLIVNIIMIQWDNVTGGPSGFPGIPCLAIGPLLFDTDKKMFYLIWLFVFIAILLALNLVDSRVGRGLRALHGSEFAADSLGVRTETYKVKIFVLSALYASLAGSLYAHYLTFVSPKTFDIFFSVELVTMVIVGGMGSIWGALFGTIFLTSLPNMLHVFDDYKDIFYGLILVSILIFLPQGLIVALRERWTARRAGRVAPESQPTHHPTPDAGLRPARNSRSSSLGAEQSPGVGREQPVLSVNDLSISFGGIMALAQVSFDLPKGAVTALIGPNGAGKTTMINVISGTYRPRKGKIQFEGRNVTASPPWAMASMGLTRTFQNVQIFDQMSVLENVMVGLHAQTSHEFVSSLIHGSGLRKEEQEIKQRAWISLRHVGLENKGHLIASNLSFGEQKRLEVARALVSDPTLVLLDEPVAGLNMTETQEMAALIRETRSRGISVLLVEHDMNLVMGVSDKVVVLNYGSKIAEGNPMEIQSDEKVLAAYLGSVK
jgi:branched-chain amino acid transport system permease protein